jgi:hypothetical protein
MDLYVKNFQTIVFEYELKKITFAQNSLLLLNN